MVYRVWLQCPIAGDQHCELGSGQIAQQRDQLSVRDVNTNTLERRKLSSAGK